MNINNVSTATAPAEVIQVDTPMPVSEPEKIRDAQKVQKQQATAPQENKLSVEQTKQLTEELNEIMDDLHTNLGFSIREDLNHLVVVEIKNRDTNELIKQIPSEELLTIKEKMEELTGLMLDQSV